MIFLFAATLLQVRVRVFRPEEEDRRDKQLRGALQRAGAPGAESRRGRNGQVSSTPPSILLTSFLIIQKIKFDEC